ncbi:MAG TPA: L-histidine N(alpha)-methyltransferase [Spongiibacteraceae bacterium]
MNSSIVLQRNQPFSFYRFPLARSNATAEILAGLRKPQKIIDPKFFYDQRGSQLYEKITQTSDYYVTRAENEILRRYAPAIAATVGIDAIVIEPGSGNCRKIEYLLPALRPRLYVPVDISETPLQSACARLHARYDWLECIGIAADYSQFDRIAELLPTARRVAFFPGSSIGNFCPEAAVNFLRRLRDLVDLEGGVLIGVDNVKDESILNRAYNDRPGVTAAFNKNVLRHINRLADADFVPEAFDHLAFFNRDKARIEMHLVSRVDQIVTIAGEAIKIAAGEKIHTENSYKYTRPSFIALATEAGLRCQQTWHDQQDYFTLYYLICDPDTVISEYDPSEYVLHQVEDFPRPEQ